jgi:hypothetical protein|tara:strand:- start:8629 stop:9291 length:663 start_codon:yes stop_codon:yes gene_type:complete
MINELIKLATHLDSAGLSKEALYLDSIIKRVAMDDDDDIAGPGFSDPDLTPEIHDAVRQEMAKAYHSGEKATPQEKIRNWIEILEAAEKAEGMDVEEAQWFLGEFMADSEEGSDVLMDLENTLFALKELARVGKTPGELRSDLEDALLGHGVQTSTGHDIQQQMSESAYLQGLPQRLDIAEASSVIRELIKASDALDRGGMTKESDSIDKAVSLLSSLVK